jgi:hypothetical protein
MNGQGNMHVFYGSCLMHPGDVNKGSLSRTWLFTHADEVSHDPGHMQGSKENKGM